MFIHISGEEGIDTASIDHYKMTKGAGSALLHINMNGGTQLEYAGPHALRILQLIKTALDTDMEAYKKNLELLEQQWSDNKAGEDHDNEEFGPNDF